MIKINSRVDRLPPKTMRSIVYLTISWCMDNLGTNHRRKYMFNISVRKERAKRRCGEFQPYTNKMVIFHDNNEYVRDLIATTIHEYTHYLQPIRSKYGALSKYFDYDNHPMEVEARNNEEKLHKNCWEVIRRSLLTPDTNPLTPQV